MSNVSITSCSEFSIQKGATSTLNTRLMLKSNTNVKEKNMLKMEVNDKEWNNDHELVIRVLLRWSPAGVFVAISQFLFHGYLLLMPDLETRNLWILEKNLTWTESTGLIVSCGKEMILTSLFDGVKTFVLDTVSVE